MRPQQQRGPQPASCVAPIYREHGVARDSRDRWSEAVERSNRTYAGGSRDVSWDVGRNRSLERS